MKKPIHSVVVLENPPSGQNNMPIFEKKITRFDGGMVNDPRNPRDDVVQIVTNFDILTDVYRMRPYRDSEDGDNASATSQKQNFALALRTGTIYSLYALGVKSGTGLAEVLFKDLTTGAVADLDDNGWSTPANNQSSSGATDFNLFCYYKRTGLIYGARAGTNIWAFSPSGAAWADSHQALTYTNIAQGLVHSKDDILYIPYDNFIASNNNGSWNTTALTLPTHLKINSICEYGNYLAIAASPLSGLGKSVVYLWDRDATLTTLSESIDWGEGDLKVLEQVDGVLIGISLSGNSTTRFSNRIIFRYLSGSEAIKFSEFISSTSGTTSLLIAKQKLDNRLYFMMRAYLNGANRDGVWSVGRSPDSSFSVVHERTPNNDTALGSGVLYNFFFVGDYLFQAYNYNATYSLSKTNDVSSFTATSIYETKLFNGDDLSKTKHLKGFTILTEPLTSSGQIVVKYKKDNDSSYTTILTHSTSGAIRLSAINDSSGSILPNFKEIQFRLESTNGAVITGYTFNYKIIDDDILKSA